MPNLKPRSVSKVIAKVKVANGWTSRQNNILKSIRSLGIINIIVCLLMRSNAPCHLRTSDPVSIGTCIYMYTVFLL